MKQFFDKFIFLILFFFLCFGKMNAQFVLNGSAIITSDSCYQLTSKINDQVGTIWNETKVNLNSSFVVSVDMYFGDTDFESADGIVFGLQRQSTSAGIQGGDIGFGGITPSLGVEFDTWQNIDFGDPEEDHIAIAKNGNLRHNTSNALAGPVQASASNPDIEDDAFHNVRILWDADSMKLSVFFDSDCEPRLTYFGDIVNDIFGGDPEVFWGFTSATGGRNSIHQVCISFTTFLDGLEDVEISCGESIQLEASGGISYKWSPAAGLSDPNIANPIASPIISTQYQVEIFDECGFSSFDDLWVNIETGKCTFTIPNIFSPNNDRRNDSFGLILEEGVSVQNYKCKIFNRWGEVVFESTNFTEFWDGTQNQKDAPVDVYIYIMSFELGGISYDESGDVTLLR